MSLIGSIIGAGVVVVVIFGSNSFGASTNSRDIVMLEGITVSLHDEYMRGVNQRTLYGGN